MRIVDFLIADLRLGIDLKSVEKVISAAAIAPLPGSAPELAGFINVRGTIYSIYNLRKMFALDTREMELEDRIILCHLNDKKVGLWVDQVMDTSTISSEELSSIDKSLPNVDCLQHVVKKAGHFILLYDWPKLLKLEKTLMKTP